MSKELETLKRLYTTRCSYKTAKKDYVLLQQALLRLEQIENSNPNKALEVLNNTISPLLEPVLTEYEDDLSDKITANYFALKQTLIKSQEQEKVLEIIFEKKVDIKLLGDCEDNYEYNTYFPYCEKYQLTQEEFEMLKRCLKQ